MTTPKRTTRKTPKLAAVPAVPEPEAPSATEPPSSLSPAAASWWRSTVEQYELDPHHLRLLSEAAWSWDRCQQARAVVDRDGMTYTDRFGQPKPRPEVAIERDARAAYLRAMRELDLDGVPDPDARPERLRRSR
jgi:phage terminase small subunit